MIYPISYWCTFKRYLICSSHKHFTYEYFCIHFLCVIIEGSLQGIYLGMKFPCCGIWTSSCILFTTEISPQCSHQFLFYPWGHKILIFYSPSKLLKDLNSCQSLIWIFKIWFLKIKCNNHSVSTLDTPLCFLFYRM